MSDRGVFAVDRGVFDHPMFAAEPFTEREAWVWLVGAAAWKQCRVRAGRRPVIVERGQAAFSERFLAVKWRWSKSRVHRFLDRLKIDAMVTVSKDHETNRITICNYEKYAFDGTSRRSKTGPQIEPLADQPRTKEEEPKNLRTEDSEATASAEPRDIRRDLFGKGLQVLASITGKTPDSCRSVVGRWLKSVNDEAIHVLGAIEDAERNRVVDPVAWITKTLQPRVQNGQGRSRTVQQAAQDQLDRLREFSAPAPVLELQPGIRDGARPPDVRLLSSG